MGIRVIFLCAGYGTRLQRDILNCHKDDVGQALKGIPKALLPIGGKSLIAHWIDILDATSGIDGYYLVTNDKYCEQFRRLSEKYDGRILIINDGTTCNENRMGAVSSINFAIEEFGLVNSDILVIGGDTLMLEDFSMKDILKKFDHHKSTFSKCALVTTYQCKDEDTTKYGILEVDSESMKVKSFLEKPEADKTASRSACPCFYLFSSSCCLLIKEFLKLKQDAPMKEKDATGNFVKFLVEKCSVFTFPISGRFDVGGLQSYKDCNTYFSSSN